MIHEKIWHMQQPNICTTQMTIFHPENKRWILTAKASLNTRRFATEVFQREVKIFLKLL